MSAFWKRRRLGPLAAFFAGLVVAVLVGLGIWAFSAPGTKQAADKAPTPSFSPAPVPESAAPTAEVGGTKIVCPAVSVRVRDGAGLQAALTAARPGAVIGLADGIYSGHFTATARASAAAPIYLCGGRGAVLDGGGVTRGYVLHLSGAAFWRLSGFTIRNGQKGVVADHTTATIIDNLDVGHLGDEGIHLRSASTYNIVENNNVHNTGLYSAKFGEGIYVGSAVKNWCAYAACQPDRSDHNTIADNTISHTTAENLDIKEGTTAGTVTGNHFDGAGMTSADSLVDVKGNGWTIHANTATASAANTLTEGYETHQIVTGWGTGNAFTANTGTLRISGYAIQLNPINTNQIGCDNQLTGPAQGLANTPCTTSPTIDSSIFLAAPGTSTGKHKHHHDS